MISPILFRASAEEFCESVVQMRADFHVDGIDLDVEDGGTTYEMLQFNVDDDGTPII